jgi:ATP-dependent Lon protease|uniref:ATPase AAA-type core domain-containing protein n=1 Tax=viral metagenome TaxID=1070528 RepID=A0A6C0CD22_9ZZZZ
MSSYTHKYNTRLTSGAIKKPKYSNTIIENNDDYEDEDPDYEEEDEEDEEEEDDEDEEDEEEEEEEEEEDSNSKFDKVEYYKLLNSLYPSKYSSAKVNNELEKNKDTNLFKNFVLRNAMFLKPQAKLLKTIAKNNLHKRFKDQKASGKNVIIINIKNNEEGDEEGDEECDEEYEEEYDEEQGIDEEDEEDEEYEEGKKDETKKNKVGKENEAELKISNKNYRVFSKILHNEDKEADYFKKCLSNHKQEIVIEKLQELQNLTTIDKPYLLHLVDLDIPNEYKACALRKINIMRSMGGGFGNSEFYKIKSWVDAFLKIPFNKYNNLPISFADGIDKCHDFMEYTKKTLDSVVYGLEDAKIQIMQMVGLWLVNPNAIGCAIAIKGPPGTGKTTLIKEGISKILNRPFALVALGGCGDAGFLDGFDYTYEGSKYGKIIDILIQCGCMNPVILFDELDKLSDSFKGQEVTGVLTHLTDSTQNTKFSDKYFSEISINMSKALFIFSYNDENAVNNVLKDRMYKIETKGYKTKEKLIIAKEHLLPKIRDEIKFDCSTIVFNDELLEYIINDFTEKEDGVRNLKRCLEIIYKKLNLYRLMKPNINLFEASEGLKLKTKLCFPCILTREIIDDLIKKENTDNIPYGMYN